MLAPVLLSLSAAAAYAQNTLESVSATMQSESQVVRVDFARPLTEVPAGFLVQSPARIALDFPGTSSAVGRSAIDVNQGNLHSLNVVQAGERTRLVLNLRQATSYKAEMQGNSLLVMLDPAVGPAKVMPVSSAFAENRNRDVLPLREVDFRLGAEKTTGRVIVDLANSQVGVDIRQQGRNLVVDFAQSTLPEGLQRRLDVADYGTPVQLIATQQVGDRVRMTIEPKGDWEHSAYQRNNQFVVEVRPRTTDATKLTQGVGYTGEKLSLNFQSIDVRTLLQVIADFTNFNIVASDSVTGTITLRLQDVPWDQALDIILEAKNLGMRKNGSVLRIAPEDEINSKEKLKFESQAAIQNLEPMQTRSFQLNYAKAPMIAQSLTGGGSSSSGASGSTARILSARGSVIAEPRTNQLFVSDIPTRIAQVAELIQKLDVSMRQVLIEARIVEASDTFSRSLGVKLGGSTKGSNSSIGTQATTSSDGTTTFSGNSSSNFVNLPASSSSGSSVGTFAVSLYNSSMSKILNLEISALEDEGKGKVVASPRVVTADQTKALIEQGTELPYQTATSSGATSISFRKANLKLEVTPQITPEGNIILTLDVNKDSVGQSTSAGYAINTKHIQTEVLVENGGTVVIGGIFELTDNTDESRVPLLGELPMIGALFRSRTRTLNKTELLVFITPKMIAERTALR
ncbi:type IV pilus secretin PilQ [Variovorax paradoxus]|uniref:type IV pilus secretin PilQ n=1 Tax=Variovorax paradoxus TaxID=34073 RepID=UPI00286A66B8|nr:type IV pilus secretin PilQ [Variovorax paradoxus]